MNKHILVTFGNDETFEYPIGISLLELSKYYQKHLENPILGAKINNNVVSLNEKLYSDTYVDFIDVNDINGQSMYQGACKFLLIVAIKELFGEEADVEYLNSLDKGLYTKVIIKEKINKEIIKKIKNKMNEIISLDLPFEKIIVSKKEAVSYLLKNEVEKASNIQNISNSTVVFYKLKSFFNYFYVDLPLSTGVINRFDIEMFDEEHLILQYPTARSNDKIPNFYCYKKTLETFNNYRNWLDIINVRYVSDLNNIVSQNHIVELIQMNKIILDQQLIQIVSEIRAKKDKIKFVLMAGPSSSGKTTTSHRVSLYLKAMGYNPHIISVDDYYKERVDCPKDGNGEYDFETPEALDLKLFNKHLKDLLSGKEVSMPKFNFALGKKEYNNRLLKLDKKDILVIEGLHCLNKTLTEDIPEDRKYKIYISPFMGLRIDHHNHISTVDIRLIRRMIRDYRYRGFDVNDTIQKWQKVREGEEKYVFPYQKEADFVLNTASVYELGVLKVYAEPLLYSVSINSPYYEEARRILGHLRIYFPIPSENISSDSILREFIGGSIFDPH